MSYASFPVTENRQIDIGNIPPNIKYNKGDPIFDKAATLSWILGLSAILFLFFNMGFNTDLTGWSEVGGTVHGNGSYWGWEDTGGTNGGAAKIYVEGYEVDGANYVGIKKME